MTQINFPNKRKEYSGVKNPIFVSDIRNANDLAHKSARSVLGLQDTDFAILSGFDYDANAHTYSTGIIFMNGNIYKTVDTIAEGKYLIESNQTELSKNFSDNNTRNIYEVFIAVATDTVQAEKPQLSGDMNIYRIDNNSIVNNVIVDQLEKFKRLFWGLNGANTTSSMDFIIEGAVSTGNGSHCYSGMIMLNGEIYFVPSHEATGDYFEISKNSFPFSEAKLTANSGDLKWDGKRLIGGLIVSKTQLDNEITSALNSHSHTPTVGARWSMGDIVCRSVGKVVCLSGYVTNHSSTENSDLAHPYGLTVPSEIKPSQAIKGCTSNGYQLTIDQNTGNLIVINGDYNTYGGSASFFFNLTWILD